MLHHFLCSRHEKRFHPEFQAQQQVESMCIINDSKPPTDCTYNYHSAKLQFGLILFNFNDAVREGDGQRLHDIYKLALLLYKSGNHTKYAYVVLLYLAKLTAFYTESEAFQLKWNRFFNKYGLIGSCISLDLKKEQQNKVLKTIWQALDSNLTKESASRVANALEHLEKIIDSIDEDCAMSERHGARSVGDTVEPVMQVISDLVEIRAFKFISGREGHKSFQDFSNSLVNVDYRDLHSWMKEKLKLWGSIFERGY